MVLLFVYITNFVIRKEDLQIVSAVKSGDMYASMIQVDSVHSRVEVWVDRLLYYHVRIN